MDALARLLDPDADLDLALDREHELVAEVGANSYDGERDDGNGGGEEDWEDHGTMGMDDEGDVPSMPRYGVAGGEEIVEEWRPLSPGGGGGSAEDWFEF